MTSRGDTLTGGSTVSMPSVDQGGWYFITPVSTACSGEQGAVLLTPTAELLCLAKRCSHTLAAWPWAELKAHLVFLLTHSVPTALSYVIYTV